MWDVYPIYYDLLFVLFKRVCISTTSIGYGTNLSVSISVGGVGSLDGIPIFSYQAPMIASITPQVL